jgi:hypothetical protein
MTIFATTCVSTINRTFIWKFPLEIMVKKKK